MGAVASEVLFDGFGSVHHEVWVGSANNDFVFEIRLQGNLSGSKPI
jgi:hypothetical protein